MTSFWLKPSGVSVGDVNLELDEIAARDRLGDRVLDLDPAVDLEEEVLAGVDVEHELDRAEVAVPDRRRERHRLGSERVARRGVEVRRGRLLDHLLVAALHRAVALAEVDDRAVLVGGDLDLDVSGVGDEPLEVQALVAERRAGFAAREAEEAVEFVAVLGEFDPAATATAGGLDQHRVSDFVGCFARVVAGRDFLAGEDRDAGASGLVAGAQLVAAQLDDLWWRPDEDEPVLARTSGELRALRQEAVAGMDRVALGPERGLDDEVVAQVALAGGSGPDAHRPVGPARRQPVAVGFGGPDHGFEAQLLAGVDDPQRDLAAVGDEHTLDPLHAGSTRNSAWPYSTSSAFAGTTSAIVPDTPAVTEFIIFMTSMMHTIVSGSTRAPTSTNGGLPGASAR